MTYYRQKSENRLTRHQAGKAMVGLSVIFVFFVLCVLYLFQNNELVEKNFELRNFEKFLGESRQANQELLVSLSERQSLDSLQQTAQARNLVSIEKPEYLKGDNDFFAIAD